MSSVETGSGGMIYAHTSIHGDRFSYLSNITVNAATIRKDVMLVLLMGDIYELRRSDRVRCHDIVTYKPVAKR
jgi:hypothetical protein